MLETFLYILIMIVILGILISIHEAGHLAAAKMFKVYCFEYSIGFGPKLLHVRRKGGETYFSIRAIPLGGYVSMYGEAGAVPEGEIEPDAKRSLNAINKGKKAVVLVAGVTMNFILGLILIFISDIAFPKFYTAYGGAVSISENETVELNYAPLSYADTVLDYIETNKNPEFAKEDYYLALPGVTTEKNYCFVLDSNVKIFGKDGSPYMGGASYVAIYMPRTLTKERDIGDSIAFYPASKEAVEDVYQTIGITAYPDFTVESFQFTEEGSYVDMELRLFPARALGTEEGISRESYSKAFFEESLTVPTKLTLQEKKLVSNGARMEVISEHNDWNGAWAQWAKDVPDACGAIVKGFGSLFTPGGFSNISGPIGMTSALPQIEALGGVGYIFYFAGLLSINLAFFNLLPFPGLDGWQLFVTGFEAITRKKMPEKVQTIATIIGFTLLGLLFLAVTIKDVIALFL